MAEPVREIAQNPLEAYRYTADPEEFVRVVPALAPTFGGIHLEDIRALDCFWIEHRLREELDIPVFHDDQRGTAILAGAAFLNAFELVGKRINGVRLVIAARGPPPSRARKFVRVPGGGVNSRGH